jgi:DNA primase
MLAVPGTKLGLVPHPSRERGEHIILVEGPPDMLAARSCGLPAVAVPGTNAWQPRWARLLRQRCVSIVMDCDAAGRAGAEQIAASLDSATTRVEVIDLAPYRTDGYDLTDRILESRRDQRGRRTVRTASGLLRPARASRPPSNRRTTPRIEEAQQ